MVNEEGINIYLSLRKADGTSSDPVPDPDVPLPIDLLPPMPWIIPVVIPIIIGGESKDAKNIDFINFLTEFHEDTEILDVHAPDDYYTNTESDLTFAKLVDPTFTNNILVQGKDVQEH